MIYVCVCVSMSVEIEIEGSKKQQTKLQNCGACMLVHLDIDQSVNEKRRTKNSSKMSNITPQTCRRLFFLSHLSCC